MEQLEKDYEAIWSIWYHKDFHAPKDARVCKRDVLESGAWVNIKTPDVQGKPTLEPYLIKGTKEDVFRHMNMDFPATDRRPLIRGLGLGHTSMSVRDCIMDVATTAIFICMDCGWKIVPDTRRTMHPSIAYKIWKVLDNAPKHCFNEDHSWIDVEQTILSHTDPVIGIYRVLCMVKPSPEDVHVDYMCIMKEIEEATGIDLTRLVPYFKK